jgi:hypothetical protein
MAESVGLNIQAAGSSDYSTNTALLLEGGIRCKGGRISIVEEFHFKTSDDTDSFAEDFKKWIRYCRAFVFHVTESRSLTLPTAELPISNENKYKAYKLSQKLIAGKGEVEITSEEATLIKEITVNYLVAGAYGQIEEIIEQVK